MKSTDILMGFFSYITQDTKESVTNQYYEGTPCAPHTKTAYIIDHLGNAYGGVYDGYGRFMTRKVFKESRKIWELMDTAQTNEEKRKVYDQYTSYLENNSYTYDDINDKCLLQGKCANIVKNPMSKWVNKEPKGCPHQGWFY